jgi:hypothetical protein
MLKPLWRIGVSIGIGLALPGCASIVNDSTQAVKFETRTADGTRIEGAACTYTNDTGTFGVKSGEVAPVRRSDRELNIFCRHPGQPTAVGRALSRVNMGLAGNVLFGGLVGAAIDHNRGVAYTYPSQVQLVFGQTLVFDRAAEQTAQPLAGVPAMTAGR